MKPLPLKPSKPINLDKHLTYFDRCDHHHPSTLTIMKQLPHTLACNHCNTRHATPVSWQFNRPIQIGINPNIDGWYRTP